MSDSQGEDAVGTSKASRRRYFGGDTLQQALVQAANQFHLDPEEIAYRVLDKRHGFVKSRKKVMIEVDTDAPRKERAPIVEAPRPSLRPPESRPRAAPAPSPTPVPVPALAEAAEPGAQESAGAGAPPRSAERPGRERPERLVRGDRDRGGSPGERGGRDRGRGGDRGGQRSGPRGGPEAPRRADSDAQPTYPVWDESLVRLRERPVPAGERYTKASGESADAAAHGIALLVRIGGLDLQGEIYDGPERLEVDLSGPDSDWCFADDGEFLMSLEHLLPRVIRSLSGETVACRVDCDNFHDIREERLRSLAQKMALEVRQSGRPRVLAAMNPADRRIIHTTLTDDPGVATESQGDGYFKRITIRPA